VAVFVEVLVAHAAVVVDHVVEAVAEDAVVDAARKIRRNGCQ
jgi:hypothetical protein